MNKRLVSVLIIGAVFGLAIGFSVHKFSGGGYFSTGLRAVPGKTRWRGWSPGPPSLGR